MPHFIYALHDCKGDERQKKGAFPITIKQAEILNAEGYGIFRTVQQFKTNQRKSDNIECLSSYAIDIDSMDKELQFNRLKKINIQPSKIIEVKRGFHVYFDLKGESEKSLYTNFMSDYVVPLFDADNGAKDLCRILRVPNFYHCKDMSNKYLCKKVYSSDSIFTQESFHKVVLDKFKKLKTDLNLLDPLEIRKIENHYNKLPRINNKSAIDIVNSIGGAVKCGNGWKVPCIAHQEKVPSLFISEGKTVPVIWHCFGGCSGNKVLLALQARGLW